MRFSWIGSSRAAGNAPDNFWVDLRPREAFDVTLFIDMTTAARSNPR
jgi:hypothetical protein